MALQPICKQAHLIYHTRYSSFAVVYAADDVDSLTLEAELPRSHALPGIPFYAMMEAERSTVAQTGSETRPSAEGPGPLELDSHEIRLQRLDDVCGGERSKSVGN